MLANRWCRLLLSVAGLLGLSGVLVGAAGSHAGGGELAKLASSFLLIHAAAVVGVVAVADRLGRWRLLGCASATCLAVGVTAFSGDLTWLAFGGNHLLGWLAPGGGTLLMVGWLGVAVTPLLP